MGAGGILMFDTMMGLFFILILLTVETIIKDMIHCGLISFLGNQDFAYCMRVNTAAR